MGHDQDQQKQSTSTTQSAPKRAVDHDAEFDPQRARSQSYAAMKKDAGQQAADAMKGSTGDVLSVFSQQVFDTTEHLKAARKADYKGMDAAEIEALVASIDTGSKQLTALIVNMGGVKPRELGVDARKVVRQWNYCHTELKGALDQYQKLHGARTFDLQKIDEEILALPKWFSLDAKDWKLDGTEHMPEGNLEDNLTRAIDSEVSTVNKLLASIDAGNDADATKLGAVATHLKYLVTAPSTKTEDGASTAARQKALDRHLDVFKDLAKRIGNLGTARKIDLTDQKAAFDNLVATAKR